MHQKAKLHAGSLNGDVEALRARVAELEAQLQDARNDREYMIDRMHDTERRTEVALHQMIESRSWRLTRPLRALRRVLSRRS